jgi:methylmalonyl-CoA mutase
VTKQHAQEPLRRIIGYNDNELPDDHPDKYPPAAEVVRPGPTDRERQLGRLRNFRQRHREEAPVALERLKQVALQGGNVFGELLDTVRHATLGEITRTLASVGGRYRKMV